MRRDCCHPRQYINSKEAAASWAVAAHPLLDQALLDYVAAPAAVLVVVAAAAVVVVVDPRV